MSDIELLRQTRDRFLQGKIDKRLLKKLYLKYNKNVEINSFINEAEKIFPRLNCGLASVYLQSKLGGKIVNGEYRKNNHTFLLLNNQVIDITADQYGGPEVYIGELKAPYSL